MAMITIPFDYDPRKDGESVVPICVNDTDENGETIFFGWIEAVVPLQDKLRALSRRVLGDVWRVSEVTDLAVHQLWRQYGENIDCHASFRLYRAATRMAHSLEDPGAREHLALNIALEALEEYRKDALTGDNFDTETRYQANLDIQRFEKKLKQMGRRGEFEVYRMLRAGYRWHEIGERAGENPNTLYYRFQRIIRKAADIS
jgi:DNA-directed RNA polymerase specialized sigma24 family protein